ncbi:hypothetical protein Tco_1061971 [Tanacetum coccineum]
MPSIPSPEPAISYFDDLDFFKDFENEFPAIVYKDAQMSKSTSLTEPILNPQHINEFNDKTSLSEYNEEKHNILYFNDLFPFNIICFDDLKSEKDNENDKIDITQPFENNEISHGSITLFETSHDKKTKDFRRESFVINLNVNIVIWIHYGKGMLFYLIKNLCAPFGVSFDPKRYYKDGVCAIMLRRPRSIRHMALPPREIYMREIHRVPVFDFGGLPELMSEGLTARLTMEHRDKAGVSVFTSQAWTRMLDIRGPLVHELILEFFSTFRLGQAILDLDTPGIQQFQLVYWEGSARQIPNKGDLRDYWMEISSAGDFLGTAPSYTLIRDPILRLCHRLIAYSIVGRSQAPKICIELNDTWAWVAMGPERQPDAAAGAPAEVEDAPIVDEGGQADLAPAQAPQQPPPPPPAPARTMVQRLGRLEDVQGLCQDVGSLRGLVERSMTDQGRFSTWMMTCMTQLMEASGLTHQAFDGSSRGSLPAAFQRRTRQRTSEASTSTVTKPGRPREGNIDNYWWRIYKSRNLEVLES